MPASVVDLFCGVGGLTKGLELAGLDVVAGFDFNETCRYAYEENNNSHFHHRDITEVTVEELEALYPQGNIKILVGCAPCQPFSKLTKRYRKEEKTVGREQDSWQVDNKWRLLYSFAHLIRRILPEIVSMENVPELENEAVFTDFVDTLRETGYHVSHQIVSCADYGVPQNRRRLVLLASRLGNIELIAPTHTPENYQTVRNAIFGLPAIAAGEVNEYDPVHNSARLSAMNLRRIRASQQGGSWREWDDEIKLPCHLKESGRSYASIYGRMSWDMPSPTITTQFYGYGNGRFGHPEQDRGISMREGALLQSFPREYRFYDENTVLSRRELGVHIGNAVPVELGRAIGVTILNHLREGGHHGN